MPRLTKALPKLRQHVSGNAVVTLDGTDIYLGRFGTDEAQANYDRVIGEYLSNGRRLLRAQLAKTINDLILAFWAHAQKYYRKPVLNADGSQKLTPEGRGVTEPTSEIENFRRALKPLRRLYGCTPIADFGSLALLVNNPGFENPLNATTDWETFATGGGTVMRVTSDLHSGSYSFYSYSTNTTGNTGAYTNWFNAPEGALVTFTAWIKYTGVQGNGPNGSNPSGVRMTLDAYKADKTTRQGWWNFVNFVTGSSNGWIQVSGSTTMPAGTVYARGRFQVDHCPGTMWDDDAIITVVTAPVAPASVQADDGIATDHVHLGWSPSGGASAYEVWRNTSNNSSGATKISTTDVTTNAYDDLTAAPGITYWYWIKAKNTAGTSAFSAADSGYRMMLRDWVGPSSGGDWSAASNWNPAAVPAAGEAVAIAGSNVLLSSDATVAGLSLTSGATLTLAAGSDSTLRTAEFAMDGTSKLDLNDNEFMIDYSGASPLGSWSGSGYTGVTGMIASSRTSGRTWDGPGITTSMPDAALGITGIGVADASDLLNLSPGATAMWGGQTIDARTIVVKYTYLGDIDLNGRINGDDYFQIDAGYAAHGSGYFRGDIDFNGRIDADDYFLIDSMYSHAQLPLAPAAVPAAYHPPLFTAADNIPLIYRGIFAEDPPLI